MATPQVLDVLIVYNGATARSATDSAHRSNQPFPLGTLNESCNASYAYFLTYCAKLGLSAGFSTSADIVGPGSCRSYWTFKQDAWHKITTPCYSQTIFDKFSPVQVKGKALRRLLFSSPKVSPYNDKRIFKIFFDKLLTYTHHVDYAIPTLPLNDSSLTGIQKSCHALGRIMRKSRNVADFSPDLIIKDRYGAGGWQVYKVSGADYQKIQQIMQKNPHVSFIIQPFTLFDARDIRLIYVNGILTQSYLRFAKSGDFRCNEHQGGSSAYLKLGEIHRLVRLMSDQIAGSLNNNNSLYALDFIIASSGTPYLIEGNTGPGLSWNAKNKQEVFMGKQLIRHIVKNLTIRLANNQKMRLKPTRIRQPVAQFTPIVLV